MIQTYEMLRSEINILNNNFEGQVFIQKIYSSSLYLCFTIRGMGKTQYLYLGRGSGEEGIWISPLKLESFLRKRDTFLEYLRKHLSSTTLESFELDLKDRIIALHYSKWGRRNTFYFFYLGRKLYFSNHFFDPDKGKMFLYCSWNKRAKELAEADFSHFDEVGRKKLSRLDTTSENIAIEKLIAREKQIAESSKVKKRQNKFLNRKIKNIKKDLDKISRWQNLFNLANTEEDFSRFPKKTTLFEVKFNFTFDDHFKRRDEVFLKVKKFKKAKIILEERLRATENLIKNKNQAFEFENQLIPVKPYWNSNKKLETSVKDKNLGSYKVYDFGRLRLGVGLSAAGNDEMRKNWATKNDYWFHLDGNKSSHIIVKLGESNLDIQVFELIASVILEHSKLNYLEANLIYTQVKNLKGIPGVTGSVNYKKEKRVRVQKKSNWRELIS